MSRDILRDVPPSFRISTHAANDDLAQWKFERNSRLPRDYFRTPRLSPSAWAFVAAGAILLGLLVAAAI